MSDFTRVQGNVQKMIGLQAPEADIDGYLASEGMTPDQFKTQVTTPAKEAPYEPDLLPIKNVGPGNGILRSRIAIGPSHMTDSIWKALNDPGIYLKGEKPLDMPTITDDARNMALNVLGLGSAPSAAGRVIPALEDMSAPVGAFAMNSIPRATRAAVKGISTVAQPVIDRFDTEGAAGRILAKRIMQQNPGMSLDDAITATQAQLEKLGPQSVLADTGEGTGALARLMINTPGETRPLAQKVLGDRNASEGSRMVQSVQDNVSPDSFYSAKDSAKASKQLAGPYYEAAYDANPNVTSPALRSVLKTEPLIKQGINNGLELKRLERSDAILKGESTEPFDPKTFRERIGFDENWDPIYEENAQTPLSLWHAAREGLDSMIDAYPKSPAGKPMLDKRGLRIQDLRSTLSDKIKELTGGAEGDFAKADQIYADASKLNTALERGRAFTRGDEEMTAKVFSAMSPEEQNAYRVGVAREMSGMIRKTGSTPSTIRAALQDTGIRDKLKTILPTNEQFNSFINDLQRETTFKQTNNLRGGSQTFPLMAENTDTQQVIGEAAKAGMSLFRGDVGGAAKAVTSAMNFLKRAQIPQATRDRIGKLLISQDQTDKDAAFRLLKNVKSSGWVYTP